jgi:hypothetical protein
MKLRILSSMFLAVIMLALPASAATFNACCGNPSCCNGGDCCK